MALLACASTASTVAPVRELTPARLYPLAKGNAWSYDVDAGDGEAVLAITSVTQVSGSTVSVRGGEGLRQYELRADGIARVGRDGYLLRAPVELGASWAAGAGARAEITRMGVVLETPAGRFTQCVEVVERGIPSGVVTATVYCPDVGPVQVISRLELTHGVAEAVARLRGYQVGSQTGAAGGTPP
jgi:hypothetical protein